MKNRSSSANQDLLRLALSCLNAPDRGDCKQNGTSMLPSHCPGCSHVTGQMLNSQRPFKFSQHESSRFSNGLGCSDRGMRCSRCSREAMVEWEAASDLWVKSALNIESSDRSWIIWIQEVTSCNIPKTSQRHPKTVQKRSQM